MELRHLRYFIAVADELSFTRAAQRLHTVQPSLSQQIRNLEEEVGTPLLKRTRRKVELTEAGEGFLEEVRLVVAQADRAVARARMIGQESRKTVRIGFVPAAETRVFPAILPRLRLRFPNLHVDLRSLPTCEQEQALLRGNIDIAFMRNPVRSPELVSEVVFKEPLVVLLPVDHPLAKLERIPPEKLDGEPFISTRLESAGEVHSVVVNFFEHHHLRCNVVQVANNTLLNLNLVGMGLGYALLPAYTATLMNNTICSRPLACEPHYVNLLMVRRAQTHSPELDGLLELVHEYASE